MEDLKRYCKACDEEIRGRSDKLFCSDYCRASHYNHRHSDITLMMRRINSALRKNRSILLELSQGGSVRVHKMTLLRKGLHFAFVTHILQNHEGKTLYFCYDQGYKDLGNGYYELIQSHSYETTDIKKADQERSSKGESGRWISEEVI